MQNEFSQQPNFGCIRHGDVMVVSSHDVPE